MRTTLACMVCRRQGDAYSYHPAAITAAGASRVLVDSDSDVTDGAHPSLLEDGHDVRICAQVLLQHLWQRIRLSIQALLWCKVRRADLRERADPRVR